MKLLVVTDIHFRQDHFAWLKKQCLSYDLVVLSGDLIDTNLPNPQIQITWVIKYLECFPQKIIVCSGNHDVSYYDKKNSKKINWLKNIANSKLYGDDAIHKIYGHKFGTMAYHSNHKIDFFKNCDYLLHHEPPKNTCTSTTKSGRDLGSNKLYQSIVNDLIKPKIIFCGHIHMPLCNQDKIGNTVILNSGTNIDTNIPNYQVLEI